MLQTGKDYKTSYKQISCCFVHKRMHYPERNKYIQWLRRRDITLHTCENLTTCLDYKKKTYI